VITLRPVIVLQDANYLQELTYPGLEEQSTRCEPMKEHSGYGQGLRLVVVPLTVCTYQQHMMHFGKSCSHCILQLSTGTVAVYTGMTLASHLCNQTRHSKLLAFQRQMFM